MNRYVFITIEWVIYIYIHCGSLYMDQNSLFLKQLILKVVCQNDRLWNLPLNDVIVELNSASAEDQRLLLHRYLFNPAHWFYNATCLAPPTDSTMLPV